MIFHSNDDKKHPNALVQDQEDLYRRVLNGSDYFQYDFATGECRPTSQAFAERKHWQPSVDRADLCHHNPKHTQQTAENFVAKLSCGEVREIRFERLIDGQAVTPNKVDVVPDPYPLPEKNNPAHALITIDPHWTDEKKEKNAYRRFKQALARKARWIDGFGPPLKSDEMATL